jgi:hypothetical protein
MERIQRGEHVYIRVLNKPVGDGVLANCDTGYPTLSIWDSAEKVLLADTTMTNQATGDYYYQQLIPTTSDYGFYRWQAKLANTAKYESVDGVFEVV